MDNKISAQLQSTVVTEILTEIDQIKSKLPFLIDLDLEARKSILKYGDRSVAFVKHCHDLGTQHKTILPQSFDLTEMGKDIVLYDQLYTIQQSLRSLSEKIESTLLEVGAEAYAAALYIYSLAKLHKELGDFSSETLDDLAKRFNKKTPPPDSK